MQWVMFDIGSGNSSRAVKWLINDRRAHAFCFDPLNECYEKGCTAAKDKYVKGRLHVFPLAVTSNAPLEGHTVPMYCANDRSSCSLLPFGDISDIKQWKYPAGRVFFRTTDVIQVPAIRMDKFIVDRRLERISFVRVETQGTALDVVRSFGQHISKVMEFAIKVHTVPFDIYQNQTTKKELLDYMDSKGFNVYGAQSWSRGQEEIIWFVNLKYARSGHLMHLDFPES
jgi:FkbM family methyltransferase